MVEVNAVIKYFCKKGMSLKEIQDDFIKTLGDESPSYSMVMNLFVCAEVLRPSQLNGVMSSMVSFGQA